MRIAAAQIATTVANPQRFVGLLVYGEDWTLVRDRARIAVRAALGQAPNPFQLTVLSREEHARLKTEAESLALGGGRRVVHVQDGADSLASTLEKLRLRADDALLVVEAGDLPPRSKLRGLAEKHSDWGAVACFSSNPAGVAAEITAACSQAGLALTPDALAYLCGELTGPAGTRRSELAKLVVYAAGERLVDLETAQSCCVVSQDATLGAVAAAALSGNVARCDALLSGLQQEGASGPGLLAVLSNQVQRLLKVRLSVESGVSPEEACRSLQPPVYPRQMAAMTQDVSRWRSTSLEAVGTAIRDADTACKRAASPDFDIAARLLLTIATRQPSRHQPSWSA